MKMRFVDVGYVIKWYETKDGNGFVYLIEGKNDVYKVFSKKFYDVSTFVFVYTDGERGFISDR